MTWYSYENYGIALQAVALNRVVGHMGYKAADNDIKKIKTGAVRR